MTWFLVFAFVAFAAILSGFVGLCCYTAGWNDGFDAAIDDEDDEDDQSAPYYEPQSLVAMAGIEGAWKGLEET